MTEQGHGFVGTHALEFTNILPLRNQGYDVEKLALLAHAMISEPDALSDGPDPEENLFMPAGYTYLGQFIDHDLTFDTTSRLNPEDFSDPFNPHNEPTNLRTPRFDLDCLYGNGPDDQPYMYAMENNLSQGIYAGATMLMGGIKGEASWDLARAGNGRALIGDKRNDENSIVNQIQQVFIRFHNKIVQWMAMKDPTLRGGALFQAARQEVTWTYQRIVMEDFLHRIIDDQVLADFVDSHAKDGEAAYLLYKNEGGMRGNLPREFVAAAYRFGHSGVRPGYRLSDSVHPSARISIFVKDAANGAPPVDSLLGFDPLPKHHQIEDWGRFFAKGLPPGHRKDANTGDTVEEPAVNPAVRLQYAYKLDPSLVDPLGFLPSKIASRDAVKPDNLRPPLDPTTNPTGQPSLSLLNLLRGNRYLIQGGQAFAAALSSTGTQPLDPKYLCIRQSAEVELRDANDKPILESGKVPAVDGFGNPIHDGQGNPVLVDGKVAVKGKIYWFEPISAVQAEDQNGNPVGTPLGPVFNGDTPLWFYILAEAQKPLVDLWLQKGGGSDPTTEPQRKFLNEHDLKGTATGQGNIPGPAAATQLGPVGGRIIAEVFYGLLDADEASVLRGDPSGAWAPSWAGAAGIGSGGPATFAKMIQAAGLKISI